MAVPAIRGLQHHHGRVRALSRETGSRIPDPSFEMVHIWPVGRTATSTQALDTSMPTYTVSGSTHTSCVEHWPFLKAHPTSDGEMEGGPEGEAQGAVHPWDRPGTEHLQRDREEVHAC